MFRVYSCALLEILSSSTCLTGGFTHGNFDQGCPCLHVNQKTLYSILSWNTTTQNRNKVQSNWSLLFFTKMRLYWQRRICSLVSMYYSLSFTCKHDSLKTHSSSPNSPSSLHKLHLLIGSSGTWRDISYRRRHLSYALNKNLSVHLNDDTETRYLHCPVCSPDQPWGDACL